MTAHTSCSGSVKSYFFRSRARNFFCIRSKSSTSGDVSVSCLNSMVSLFSIFYYKGFFLLPLPREAVFPEKENYTRDNSSDYSPSFPLCCFHSPSREAVWRDSGLFYRHLNNRQARQFLLLSEDLYSLWKR